MVGWAIINAFAYAWSNFLFSMFRNKDIDKERKWRDLAIEQLQKAWDKWPKKRRERLNFINETSRGQKHAISTFKDVDNVMYEYSLVCYISCTNAAYWHG